jgi:Glycosyl hydrolase-like 10
VAQKLLGYYMPYTGTLQGQSSTNIRSILSSVVQNYNVREFHLDALAAAGLTFQTNNVDTLDNFGNPVTSVDIFEILKDEKNKWLRDDLRVLGWVEAWGYTFPGTRLFNLAIAEDAVLSSAANRDGVCFIDPLNPLIHSIMKQAVVELANRPYIWGISVDDHFGFLNSTKKSDGSLIDLKAAMLRRYPAANSYSLGADQWFTEQITLKLKDLSDAVRATGTNFFVSTNPFDWAKTNTHQDPKIWYQRGLVDGLNVQVYRNTITDFKNEINKIKATCENLAGAPQIPVSIGLALTANTVALSQQTVIDQVNATLAMSIQNLQVLPVGFDYQKWRNVTYI